MDFPRLGLAKPLVAAHLKTDFSAFCRACWPHLHPGTRLSWTWGHDLLAEWLTMVEQKRCLRLILNTPPRFAKSSIAAILFPIWCWLRHPELSFLCASYEIDLSTSHNGDRRRLMDSKFFRDLFADSIKLSTDRSLAGEFSNTAGGLMQAASANSKAQGRGGDVVICDDLLSADMAFSEVFRNETNSWLTHQLPQRLNNPAESAIILIMQRLHQNDPTGFLLAQEDSDWVLVKLALIAESDEVWEFPISHRIVRRKKGECLDPKRWSAKVVRQRQQNRLVWAGQFQQEPMDPAGNMIKTDDICHYGGRDPRTNVLDPLPPSTFDRKIISVDCSFKDRPANDYVAIIVVGVVGARRYILHVTNAHLDLDGTINEIRNARNVFAPVSAILVEDKANGSAVISKLSQEIPGVIAVNPQGGKMTRLAATAPEFQARNWSIERNGPWSSKIIEQLSMFPNCKNDDLVDAISQTATWLMGNSYDENALVIWMKNDAAGKYDEQRKVSRWQRLKRSLGLGASVNQPLLGTETPAMPASCPLCGANRIDFEPTGSGARLKFFCKSCWKYFEGVPRAEHTDDRTKCPVCGLQGFPIAGQLRCWEGHQWWPGEPPEIPRVTRGDYNRGRFGRF
jgi:predicted phage terminase large subunit-like protein